MPERMISSTSPSPQSQQNLSAIALPRRKRGLIVGTTESGKSTLEAALIRQWILDNGTKSRVLILDSKPRFRAERLMNNLPAWPVYRKWGRGEILPDSYLMDLKNPKAEMRRIWKTYQAPIALAQVTRPSDVPYLKYVADCLFEIASDKEANLAVFDEVRHFYRGGAGSTFDPILRIWCAGAEKNIAGLGTLQRPKGTPVELRTELTCLYLFDLAFEDDIEHWGEMGLPPGFRPPPRDERYAFRFYNKQTRKQGTYRLAVTAPERKARWSYGKG